MNAIFHAAQARRLNRLVGGVEAAAALLRVSPAQVSNYQLAHKPDTMRADQIAVLEAEAGCAIYSAALSNLVSPAPSASLLCDAMDAARIAGGLPADIHAALADGRLDEAERRTLQGLADNLRAITDAISSALSGGGAS